MSHPPFAPASAAGLITTGIILHAKRRHREQQHPLRDLYSSTTGNETRTANPAPQSVAAVSVPRSFATSRARYSPCRWPCSSHGRSPGEAFQTHTAGRTRPGRCRGRSGRLPYRPFHGKGQHPAFRAHTLRCCSTCPSRKHSPRRSANTVSSASQTRPGSVFLQQRAVIVEHLVDAAAQRQPLEAVVAPRAARRA